MELVITSKQNNIVKYVRGLRDKRTREQEQRFVIEGFKAVSEAWEAGIQPEKLFVTEHGENQPLTGRIIAQLKDPAQVIRVSETVMEHMCETETPQGIAALLSIPERSLAGIKAGPDSLFVIVDGVQDPGNVGTVIRTADAFKADAVLLTGGCADLYNAKTLRSTMGSVFHLPVINGVETAELTSFLQAEHVFAAATILGEASVLLNEANLKRPLALIFGSEAKGVSAELIGIADTQIKIPMAGAAQSLNVATAAGIVIYEAFRQHGSSSKSNL